jgi:hypothetical protein
MQSGPTAPVPVKAPAKLPIQPPVKSPTKSPVSLPAPMGGPTTSFEPILINCGGGTGTPNAFYPSPNCWFRLLSLWTLLP